MSAHPSTSNNAAQPEAGDPLRPTAFWGVLRMFARFWMVMMFDLKVHGRGHVPNRGGVLLVANHQSYLDPIVLGVFLRRPMSYMAKSELFSNRYFRWLIMGLNAFPIKQGTGDVGAVKETIRRLREGHILNIFPEGSRTEDGEIAPLLPGAALAVKRAGVPIIPVVIEGSFQAWPKECKLPRAHPIDVMFGPTMDLATLDSREILERIDDTLRSMFAHVREMRRQQRRGCSQPLGSGQ